MIHKYIKGTNNRTLVLLHGTGGTEKDLIEIGEHIDKDANILTIRGNVLENNMSRYFRRLSEGIFDEKDLVFRANELFDFIKNASKKYEFDITRLTAVGYSNGANIAATILLLIKDSFSSAILYHPMVPIRNVDYQELKGIAIFIGAGINDPICSLEESNELIKIFEDQFAKVSIHFGNDGHRLTHKELDDSKDFYSKFVMSR